jgi:hypothetical protein
MIHKNRVVIGGIDGIGGGDGLFSSAENREAGSAHRFLRSRTRVQHCGNDAREQALGYVYELNEAAKRIADLETELKQYRSGK